jgi:hypothetical protein
MSGEKPVAFHCPICRSRVYHALGQTRSGLAIHECAGCSILFRDPVKFTRFEPYSGTIAAPDFRQQWRR